jgi:hypothetical protein
MSFEEGHQHRAAWNAQQAAGAERQKKWWKDWVSTGNMPAESFWSAPSTPNPSFLLSGSGQRQIETRRYDGISETDLLTASTNVLQDLGFIIENSETELGVITASKKRDITNTGEIAFSVAMTALLLLMWSPIIFPVKKDQTFRVALVVRPVLDSNDKTIDDSHLVRITFQSIVRDTFDKTILVKPVDFGTYQGFFEKLSKSVFLEAQEI